jgi:hypothetical protein
VDTEHTVDQQLVRYAEWQTKALESINMLVLFLLILAVLSVGIWGVLAAVG